MRLDLLWLGSPVGLHVLGTTLEWNGAVPNGITIAEQENQSGARRIRRVSQNPPISVILSRLFEYGATPKLRSGKTDVLDVQSKQ